MSKVCKQRSDYSDDRAVVIEPDKSLLVDRSMVQELRGCRQLSGVARVMMGCLIEIGLGA